MNKLKVVLSSIAFFALAIAPIALSTNYVLAQVNTGGNACGGTEVSDDFSGTKADCNTSGNNLPEVLTNIINIFSWIVGVVSVIMIIYGGFRYITSGGDQNGVTAAKNTILYAVVGLIIVALAQVIVQFVLKQANEAAG